MTKSWVQGGLYVFICDYLCSEDLELGLDGQVQVPQVQRLLGMQKMGKRKTF